MRLHRFAVSVGLLALSAPSLAQTGPHSSDQARDPYHLQPGSDIIVTAPFQRDVGDLLSGVSVVSGLELTRDLRTNIADTLARQPGVSTTSFGPNASRPVLRGFQGERVRVLTDGIGSFDVSNTSVDHAVAINPLTADRVEVLRGPSALLFGSSAIGGVVNVIDSRIPRVLPDEAIHIDAIGTYGSAADQRSIAAAVEAPIAGKIVLHIDGSYTKTDDLEVGGYVLTPALRQQAAASEEAEIAELADLRGRLPNTASRTWDVAGGLAVITEGGNLGFSVSHMDSIYGVPVRYSLDPEVEAEAVRLDMRQTRIDLRGEVETGGNVLSLIRLRAGYADYRHDELEDTGEIGTSFFNDGYEARLEFVQAERGGWRGAFGGQMFIRDFSVVGEEKYLPATETQQFGLFTLQEFDFGKLRAEFGGRYERSYLNARADEDLGNADIDRQFNAFSGSVGASYELTPGWRIGINGSRTERAPSAEELFANGAHPGTQAFEVGNPDFVKEKSWGVEAVLRGRGAGYSFAASAYHSWFKDYIYEFQTGETDEESGLPIFQFAQADARYYGFEVEGSATLVRLGGTDIVADAQADYVRARIIGDGPAPRIPPLRVLGGIEAQAEKIDGRVEIEWADRQDRVTAFETETKGYTLVNASLAFRPFGRGNNTSIILSANNLFDVNARRHASFLKDYAPLAGRDIRITARLTL